MSAKLQTVHVRVNDAATGQPTPVRVRFTDADGVYYAPLGRLTDFATGRNQDVGGNVCLGGQHWAYVDDSFEIDLPPGTIHVAIHKGLEYRPLIQTIQLKPGKLALRLSIERWIDLPALGWYSGDGRAHFVSPHAALLEAQAEDIHVVNLLATASEFNDLGNRTPVLANILAFSGQRPCLESANHMVVVNTHNTHPVLGSLGLLNCHRAVYPLAFGGPGDRNDWTLADWCDQCHRKNGLAVWTRARKVGDDGFLGEPLIDLLLGKIDAFEVDPSGAVPLWYDLLEAGIRIPLIGSSGKDSNAMGLGEMRTFARLQQEKPFSYQTWVEAVRAGCTFITNGPVLLFTVNDQDPGVVLALQKSGETVRIHAEVKNHTPAQRLEIVLNGAVVETTDQATIDVELPIQEGGWLAARYCAASDTLACPNVSAHTSPIYVQFENTPVRRSPQAVRKLLLQIDRLEAWVNQIANVPSDHARTRFLSLARAARGVLQAYS